MTNRMSARCNRLGSEGEEFPKKLMISLMRTRSDLVVKNELGRTVRQLGNEIAFLKTEIYLSEVNSRSTSPLMARTSALRRSHYRHTADEEAS
jgi:hypothetical protein